MTDRELLEKSAKAAGYVIRVGDGAGTALVSGFSPSLMKSILSSKDLNPENVMMETLNNPRYAVAV